MIDETTAMQLRVIALENNLTTLTNDIHNRLTALEKTAADHISIAGNLDARIKALEDARKVQIGLNTQFQTENKRSIFSKLIGK